MSVSIPPSAQPGTGRPPLTITYVREDGVAYADPSLVHVEVTLSRMPSIYEAVVSERRHYLFRLTEDSNSFTIPMPVTAVASTLREVAEQLPALCDEADSLRDQMRTARNNTQDAIDGFMREIGLREG